MRTLAATAAFASALAAAPEGHAQTSGAGGRIAPQAVYEVSPPLGAYTDAQLFGRVWADPTLAPRDRSLVTVAALIAGGRIAQVGSHSGRALDNGVTPEELGEVLAHLAFYAGWPVAISAVFEIREVFDARGIAAADPETGDLLDLDPEAEAARRAAVAANAAPFAPGLAGATDEVLFADLWRRPGLAPRDRSLVTVAALIAMGQAEQAPFHLNRAMDNGLTRDEAAELVHHAAYYAGWPRAFSAVAALKTVFEAREAAGAAESPAPQPTALSVVRPEAAGTVPGPAERFSGEVTVGPLFAPIPPARLSGGLVSFAASARTAWHTHPLGQTLYVTAGCGWVQSEGAPVQAVRPGDIVQIPAGVRHWHGASETEAMSHVAMLEAPAEGATTWMELVSDADYLKGRDAADRCPG